MNGQFKKNGCNLNEENKNLLWTGERPTLNSSLGKKEKTKKNLFKRQKSKTEKYTWYVFQVKSKGLLFLDKIK